MRVCYSSVDLTGLLYRQKLNILCQALRQYLAYNIHGNTQLLVIIIRDGIRRGFFFFLTSTNEKIHVKL